LRKRLEDGHKSMMQVAAGVAQGGRIRRPLEIISLVPIIRMTWSQVSLIQQHMQWWYYVLTGFIILPYYNIVVNLYCVVYTTYLSA